MFKSILIIVIPLLMLLPWMWFNYFAQHKFILLEPQRAECNAVTGALGIAGTVEGDYRALADIPRDESVYVWAVKHISSYPVQYTVSVVKRLVYIFSFHTYLFSLWFLSVVILLKRKGMLAIFPFRMCNSPGIAGSEPALAFFDRSSTGVNLLIAYFIFIHALPSVEERYMQALLPLISCTTVYGLASFYFSKEESLCRTGRVALAIPLLVIFAVVIYMNWLILLFPLKAAKAETDPLYGIKLADNHLSNPYLQYGAGIKEIALGRPKQAIRRFLNMTGLDPVIFAQDIAVAVLSDGKNPKDIIYNIGHLTEIAFSYNLPSRYAAISLGYAMEENCKDAEDYYKKVKTALKSQAVVKSRESALDILAEAKLKKLSENQILPEYSRFVGPEVRPQVARTVTKCLPELISLFQADVRQGQSAAVPGSQHKESWQSRRSQKFQSIAARKKDCNPAPEKFEELLRLQKAGRFDVVKILLEQELNKYPRCLSLLNSDALNDALQGDYLQAERKFQSIIRMSPEFSQAYISLALIYEMSGDKQKAVEIYNKALASELDNEKNRIYIQSKLDGLGGQKR